MNELIRFRDTLNECVNILDKAIELSRREESGEQISKKEQEEMQDKMLLAFIKLQRVSQEL